MPLVTGTGRILSRLNDLVHRSQRDFSVVYEVEYRATYAVVVHENLRVRFRNGQAKFLEEPARTHIAELRRIVVGSVKKTGSVRTGVRLAAKKLLELSQGLVPVKTGKLKRSGRVVRVK